MCCRRADRLLRLVAVASDDCSEEDTDKDAKIASVSLLTVKESNLLPSVPPQRAMSNLYDPEPVALAKVKIMREDQRKNSETAGNEYCPMNGSEPAEYLQPVSERPGAGYLPMGLPPGYDNCVSPPPQVSYANTEHGDPTIDMTCETDCGMMGYDVPPPQHVYSEIPANDDDDVDDAGENHIYESLDQATKPH